LKSDRGRTIHQSLGTLLESNAELLSINSAREKLARSEYSLRDAATLIRLLVGSEGTLALTTEASLRTIPLACGRSAVVLGFSTFDAALQAAMTVADTRPSACLVFDRRLLSLARAHAKELARIPVDVEAAVFVEYEGALRDEADEAARSILSPLHDVRRSALLAIPLDADASALPWSSESMLALYAIPHGRRPLSFVDDIGLAIDLVPEFIRRANTVLKEFDVTASTCIDACSAHVQIRPFLDPDCPEDASRLWPLAEQLHGLALDMGGTIGSKHGIGIARTPWMSRQLGVAFPLLQEIKRIFDPRGIWNPGKIVGLDPSRPAWPLRSMLHDEKCAETAESINERSLTPLLVWKPNEMNSAIAACNGCGACRDEAAESRMCPTFRVTHSELAAPRAKANLFRSLIENGLKDAEEQELRTIADLCINCKMCATECPGKADIPKLMLEAKAANHIAHGWRRSTWVLARIDGLAGIASNFALTANTLLRRRPIRWALEKVVGLSRQRTLPTFTFRTFLGKARGRGLTRRPSEPGVAYFVDTYANLFDPSIADATIAVLRHNGIPVYVPPRQRGCGAMALAHGDVDVARERLTYNARRLADCVRNGDTIVCSEPTAALFFRLDALGLLDDPDVLLVAQNTVELTSYLWSLHKQGRLRGDFQALDMQIGHHVPCHIKALGNGVHGPDLLALIPELQVNKIDLSCSGMAGTYGLNSKNYETSMAIGRPMLDALASPANRFGSSECSACRLQMQEGTRKRAMHPVQFLAIAYGLMPGLAERLNRPIGRLVSR
jgi:Fe-S oxidoreductase